MSEPQRLRVLLSTRRRKQREDKIPTLDPKKDVYVVTCQDRQRITRFEYVSVPKGDTVDGKHCPRCGGWVRHHEHRPLVRLSFNGKAFAVPASRS